MCESDVEETLKPFVIHASRQDEKAISPKKYMCHVCDKTYCSATSLANHRRTNGHKLTKKVGIHVCKVCNRTYQHLKNLKMHQHSHSSEKRDVDHNFACKEEECNRKFPFMRKLIEHLKEAHDLELDFLDVTFKDYDEFLNWKQDLELLTNTEFRQFGGKKRNPLFTKQYFYCSRSGMYKQLPDAKRICHSKKINFYCTCHFIAIISNETKEIKIRYYQNHYGHEIKLKTLQLPDRDKEFVVHKLRLGVSIDNILNGIATNVGPVLKRIDLLTRQDIFNIAKTAGIKVRNLDAGDETKTLHILIDELRSNENNPILAYKLSGDMDTSEVNENRLDPNDFLLVIQTDFQKHMFQEFGMSGVYMDVTHSTNSYSYKLISVIVTDDYGEGIPIAWCISNRDDTVTLFKFFTYVKENSGLLEPSFFMSEDAPHYFDSWIKVFEGSPKKLLCSWHTHNAWIKNLQQIQDPVMRADVLKILQFLLEETNIKIFNAYMQHFEHDLEDDEKTKKFSCYFNNFYQHRPQEWAYCYREGLTTNTKTVCETFHKVLNYKAKEGRVNKRIDKLVYALLKFQRQKVVERVAKLEKENPTSAVTEIHNRHDDSCNRPFNLITGSLEEQEFKIKAEDDSDGKEYLVKFKSVVCKCELRCSKCDICVHGATCDCSDFLLHGTICQHIHLLQWYRNTYNPDEDNTLETCHVNDSTCETMDATHSDENDILPKTEETLPVPDIPKFKEQLISKCFQMAEKIRVTNSVDTLNDVEKYFKIVSDILKL